MASVKTSRDTSLHSRHRQHTLPEQTSSQPPSSYIQSPKYRVFQKDESNFKVIVISNWVCPFEILCTSAQKLLCLPWCSKSLYLQQLHHTTFFHQVAFQRAGNRAPWDDSEQLSVHRFGQLLPTAKRFGQAWQAP